MRLKRSMIGLFAVAAFIACSAFACSKHQAVVAEHDFKIGIKAAQDIEISEFNAGNVPADFHKQFETTILKVAQVGEQVSKDMAANASNATVVAELGTIINSLQVLVMEGTVGIKNPTTQTNVNTALQAAIALVKNLQTALGGKI